MDNLELRKLSSNLLKKSKHQAKPDKCIMCGEPQTSFCNSHLIPQMILKNIAKDGKVLYSNSLVGFEVLDIEKGVNNAGTFHYICSKCDGMLFQSYENREALKNIPSDIMLSEIAMKNMLMMLSKRNEEKQIYAIAQKQYNGLENKEVLDEIQDWDTIEYLENLEIYKKIIDTKSSGCFQILYWNKLPYVSPIAVQTPIVLYKDMNGDIVNDVYSDDPKCRMQNMHLCIFPMENETVILLFYHKRNKNYRKLRHQFNSISEGEKLEFINYIIFAYTENYFISKTIQEIIESDENLKKLSQECNGNPNFGFLDAWNMVCEYTPVDRGDIPNFLLKEYALQECNSVLDKNTPGKLQPYIGN